MSVAHFRQRNVNRAVPEAIAAAFAQFEKSVGGRPALIAVLSMAELTPEMEQVLCAIGDPANDRVSLADICNTHGLQPGQVIMAYHRAQMQQVQVLALSAVAGQVPAVISEIVRTALPRTEDCTQCKGIGTIAAPRKRNRGRKPAPLVCPACGGKGKAHHDGIGSQQDRILDLARLVTKGGGVNVAVQANTNVTTPSGVGSTSSPLGQLQQAIHAALTKQLPSPPAPDGRASEPRTVDAVVIPEPTNEREPD